VTVDESPKRKGVKVVMLTWESSALKNERLRI